ncbi:MAG: Lrp/AsnC family transcriptional regulator [Anaerolineae bacterium]|jgi:Lrp/AsnC family transcriptional regulator, regulator for asnA, asnC and gidA|nr:Lrp/AsnC family transcriptional regulator [Anaerolineae bacterium]
MTKNFDILDRHIIELLQKNGRATSAEISRKLNVPERTVRNRILRMEEHKLIHPTVVVNHRFFGYKTAVDIFCEIDINKFEEIGQALMQLPEINYIAYATGDQDISIQALFESSEDIYEFTQKLVRIPGIQRTKTVVVPRILKNTFEWIPPEDDFEEYGGDLSPVN